jgi:hypothetical protein
MNGKIRRRVVGQDLHQKAALDFAPRSVARRLDRS